MNTLELFGTWDIIKGKLKQQYAILTDDDLIYIDGAEDELFGRLRLKLGKTKQEIIDLMGLAQPITF
jgi:uncharacterized protein YjbJ (UPF0337 family)